MAIATDAQVQQFFNDHVRKRCEQVIILLTELQQDTAQLGDIYNNWTQQSPTFIDNREDVPHKATPENGLAWNAFAERFKDFCAGTLTDGNKNEAAGNMAVIRSLCVRQLE